MKINPLTATHNQDRRCRRGHHRPLEWVSHTLDVQVDWQRNYSLTGVLVRQRCPACRERAVELQGNVELDGPGGIAPAKCTVCGATWYECYELSGYCGLEKEGKR